MKTSKVPGVSIAPIEKGQVVLCRQYGVRRAGSEEKVTADNVFEACS